MAVGDLSIRFARKHSRFDWLQDGLARVLVLVWRFGDQLESQI